MNKIFFAINIQNKASFIHKFNKIQIFILEIEEKEQNKFIIKQLKNTNYKCQKNKRKLNPIKIKIFENQ